MRWFSQLFQPMVRTANILDLTSTEQCRTLFTKDLAVIFKHSEACDRSQGAYRTIAEFCAKRPDVHIYVISVLESRAVAQFVETETGVRHESPQVLAIRNGMVFAHASHRKITPAFLETLC